MDEERTILLIEDDEAHAKAVKRAFASGETDVRLVVVSTLQEARTYLKELEPDLVITDLILPDGKGTDLITEEKTESFPVLVMTAYGTQELAVEVMKAGALDYVVKSESIFSEMPQIARRAIREWDHILRRRQAEESLRRIEWLLKRREKGEKPDVRPYGDLTCLNTSRVILDAVGEDVLPSIAREFLDLLGTSGAVYEKTGDYALGIFAAGWCRFLDDASYRACGTDDPEEALKSGLWHCHESCWTNCARVSIESGEPVDIECAGGIHLYAIPIRAYGEIIGAINVGYGDPPRDPEKLHEIAKRYGVRVSELVQLADSYKSRPDFITDLAKYRLESAARLIGVMVERKWSEEEIKGAYQRLDLVLEAGNLGFWDWNRNTDEVYYDERWASMLGYSHAEIEPRLSAWKSLVHPDDKARVLDQVENHVRGLKSEFRSEQRLRTKWGDWKWILAIGRVVERNRDCTAARILGIHMDITDRVKAEEDLKQSRKAFTNIVERSADGILVVGPNGNVLYANHSATTLLGKDYDSLKEALFGTPTTNEEVATIHIIRSNAEIREVELRTAPTDWFGQPARIVMLRDMTERARYEQALLHEKEKTEQYINVAGVLFVVLDANGSVVTVNRKTCEVLGREIDDLVGCDWFSMAPPLENRDEVRRIFDYLMEGRLNSYEYVEAPIVTKSGETRIISWHNALLKDENRAVFGTVSSGEDITQRKEMEVRLAESEERYRVLFEQASEAILIARPEGEILTANHATADLFGVRPEELTNVNIKDFYQNPDDRMAFRREIESKGFVKDYPVEMKQRDGTEKLCLLSSSLWEDREGNIIGYLSMFLDVTEHRKLEEQLRQAQKMESIGTLAGGIAHDFNNILTIVQGYSEMVLADKSQDHPDYEDLSAIHNAARKGADLVKQLMTFSRKIETDMRPVNLNKEVQNALKLISRSIPKMIDIQMNLAPDISRINADSGQIEQVILNLAVNAKHAMPDGGTLTFKTDNITLDEAYCIKHAEAVPGDYVCLMIEDTGSGMSKDVVDRIFEPFFSTKKAGEGTGLGLAMVYGIVKNHGGHITCYSEPNAGATFKIYLPVIEDLAISGEFKIQQDTPGGAETILLVDDEELIRSLGKKMLQQAGYTVMEARTGEEALETYREHGRKIDLVLLDLIMPGMGGDQALDELKKMDSGVCVIIASGYSRDGHVRKTTERGAASFVDKPFGKNDLLRKIREILDQ